MVQTEVTVGSPTRPRALTLGAEFEQISPPEQLSGQSGHGKGHDVI